MTHTPSSRTTGGACVQIFIPPSPAAAHGHDFGLVECRVATVALTVVRGDIILFTAGANDNRIITGSIKG
jgi:hypothetical protein